MAEPVSDNIKKLILEDMFKIPPLETPSSRLHSLRLEIAKELELILNYDVDKGRFDIDVINPYKFADIMRNQDDFAHNVIICELAALTSLIQYYYHHYLKDEFANKTITALTADIIKDSLEYELSRDYGGYPPEYVLQYMYRQNLMAYEALYLDRYIKYDKGGNKND